MSEHSNIEWTDATRSITVGCDKVSPGCANCYATKEAIRMGSNPNPKISDVYSGLAFGVPNGTVLNVYQLLQATNNAAAGGQVWGSSLNLRTQALLVFYLLNLKTLTG